MLTTRKYIKYLNLITNAIKYATSGSIIEIIGHVDETLSIEFKNVCKPLTKKQMWNRFYNADESHNRDIKGSRLGLSIVNQLWRAAP